MATRQVGSLEAMVMAVFEKSLYFLIFCCAQGLISLVMLLAFLLACERYPFHALSLVHACVRYDLRYTEYSGMI